MSIFACEDKYKCCIYAKFVYQCVIYANYLKSYWKFYINKDVENDYFAE